MGLFYPRCRTGARALAEQIARAFARAATREVPICPFLWLNGSLDLQHVVCSPRVPGKAIAGT